MFKLLYFVMSFFLFTWNDFNLVYASYGRQRRLLVEQLTQKVFRNTACLNIVIHINFQNYQTLVCTYMTKPKVYCSL